MRAREFKFRFKDKNDKETILSDIFCLNSIINHTDKKVYIVDTAFHNTSKYIYHLRKVTKNYLFGTIAGHDTSKEINTIDFHTGHMIGPVRIVSISDIRRIRVFIYDV